MQGNVANSDSESLRLCYEGIVKHNPNNIEAVYYLAVWHLERHSFQQARRYFGHLASLRPDDAEVWLCLSVCCALGEEFQESNTALATATRFITTTDGDIRVKFCQALLAEKKKDFPTAMERYTSCLNQCNSMVNTINSAPEGSSGSNANNTGSGSSSGVASATPMFKEMDKTQKITFLKEVRGEVMLRIAMLKKEMGAVDQAMQMCNTITSEPFSDSIRANALCLKGLLHEIRAEFPNSEVVYRSVLHLRSDHCTALERLGRVYLRYRETIPAAVQCFFKAVETNPSNHVAWYLLGRCYMATSQYSDAYEAYNRAINLNPNDPQIWCSLGVLYYAFGQYREALGMLSRALKLDPTMADAWYNVGALYDMCDQPDDAQQAYLRAKENGLNDRFQKAGLGLNHISNQSLQYVVNNGNPNLNSPVFQQPPNATGTLNAAVAHQVMNNVNNATAGLVGSVAAVGNAPSSSSGSSGVAAANNALRQQQLQQHQQMLQLQQQQHQLLQHQQQQAMQQQQQQLAMQQAAQQQAATQAAFHNASAVGASGNMALNISNASRMLPAVVNSQAVSQLAAQQQLGSQQSQVQASHPPLNAQQAQQQLLIQQQMQARMQAQQQQAHAQQAPQFFNQFAFNAQQHQPSR